MTELRAGEAGHCLPSPAAQASTKSGSAPHPDIILQGMLRSPNFGDILIAKIITQWIREHSNARIVSPSIAPAVRRELDVGRCGVAELIGAKAAILSGGGHFQIDDAGIGPFKRVFRNTWSLPLAKLLGKPTAVVGVGVGRVPYAALRIYLRHLFAQASRASVRDTLGFDQIHQLGLRSLPDRTADVVFALTPDRIPSGAKAAAKNTLSQLGGEKIVGIHLSGVPDQNDNYGRLYSILERRISIDSKTKFLLIDDHRPKSGLGPQQLAQDYLLRRLGPKRAMVLPYPGAFELTAFLGELDAVLTDKLHVGLVAAAMGTPPFSIAKNSKNVATYRDLKASSHCILLSRATESDLERIINDLFGSRDRFAVTPEVRSAALRNKQLLVEFLGDVGISRADSLA